MDNDLIQIIKGLGESLSRLGAYLDHHQEMAKINEQSVLQAKPEDKPAVTEPKAEAPKAEAPKATSLDDLRKVLSKVAAKGAEGQNFLTQLLQNNGGTRLSQISHDKYTSMKLEAEEWLNIPF